MSQRAEIPALTGLRGVAALLVVIAHFYVWCAPAPLDSEPVFLRDWIDHSALAMHLFFGLSGFVILYNYAELEWRKAPLCSAAYFGWLRFARLYPAYLLFMVLAAQRQAYYPNGLKWTLLHLASLQSWLPAKAWGTLPIDGVYNVSWSISTEWGLYAAFVIAAIAMSRFGLAALFAIVCCTGLSIWLFPHWAAWLPHLGEPLTAEEMRRWFYYLSPLDRLIDFGAGAALAFATMRWPRLSQSRIATAISAPFAIAPLIFVGECSYSLYLFHELAPRIDFVGTGLPELVVRALNIVVSLGLAVALAEGLYLMVERPARRWLRNHAPEYPKPQPKTGTTAVARVYTAPAE